MTRPGSKPPPRTDKATNPSAGGTAPNLLPMGATWALAALEDAPVGVVMIDAAGRIVFFNAVAEGMFQYKAGEVIGQPVGMLAADSTRKALDRGWRHHLQRGSRRANPHEIEVRARRKAGGEFPMGLAFGLLEADGGRYLLGVVRDVTQSKRQQTVQALLHKIDHRILRHAPVNRVLQFLCKEVARLFHAALVMITAKGPDGTVSLRARAGGAAHLLEGVTIRWDEHPLGAGPTGAAIRSGRLQRGTVAGNPSLAPWSEIIQASGVRAYLALPLVTHGRNLGALTLYTTDATGFDRESTKLLTAFADQVAMSLQAVAHLEQIHLLTTALESAANGVVITDRDGRIEWVNPAFTSLTGYSPEEAIGRTPRILRSGYYHQVFYKQLWDTILSGEVWRSEMVNRRKDGTLYIEEMAISPVRNDQGQITNFVAIKQEITERKRQEEQVRYLAAHDAMTGLPNRRGLNENLALAAERVRQGEPGALLMLDVDDFKLVNDTLGHQAGDQVLVTLASLLRRVLRPQDFAARFGGDEIAVLLWDVSPLEAQNVAERLRQAVSEYRFQVNGRVLHVTISIGIALLDGSLDTPSVQSLADAALYAAKEAGKNKVVLLQSEDEKHRRDAESYHWAGRLREALGEDRLELHFQPVMSLHTDQVTYYEALVRMRDEQGELVYPAAFIQAAERFGLISKVDWWVVEQVLKVLAGHPQLRIFVNLSGMSIGNEALLQLVEERLRHELIQPGQLGFEVMETAVIKDLDQVLPWMNRVNELGCLFALDDFGIGFSSFSYLRALPIKYVKLDGSFVRNLDHDPANRALVQAMNAVAHTLGMEVIAEWVESEAVESVLRELGVDHCQGYRWGQPSAGNLRVAANG